MTTTIDAIRTMTQEPPAEYEKAMAELEARASRGEMSISQVRREISALRERFAVGPSTVMQWAANAQRQARP